MALVDQDREMLEHCRVTAQRSSCIRRHVGCVGVDAHGRILAMGRNGVPMGVPHCNEATHTFDPDQTWPDTCAGATVKGVKTIVKYPNACAGAGAASGTSLELCRATHAEQNMLMFCPDVMKLHTVYVTASPCNFCVSSLLNTSARRVVFQDEYPHGDSKLRWLAAGREWIHLGVR